MDYPNSFITVIWIRYNFDTSEIMSYSGTEPTYSWLQVYYHNRSTAHASDESSFYHLVYTFETYCVF